MFLARQVRRLALTFALTAIACGIAARIWHLNEWLLFGDESYGAFRATGHVNVELGSLFDGRLHAASELTKLQQVDPSRGPREIIAAISREEPQRAPLYYILVRLWTGIAGDSPGSLRTVSALLGIVSIGLAFLAVLELTAAPLAALFAAALIAVSPVQLHYATQVREYSALTAATLVSLWLLARCLRKPSMNRWVQFAFSIAGGFYLHAEFVLVVLALAVAVTALYARRGRHVLLSFLASSAAGAAAYVPWLVRAAPNASRGISQIDWVASPYSVRATTLHWLFNVGASWFDGEYAAPVLGFTLLPILAIVIYAAKRFSAHDVDLRIRWLIWALAFSSVLPIAMLDVVRHAHYVTITRYMMSSWTGLTLLVAVGLAYDVLRAGNGWRQGAATLSFAFLVFCSVYSAALAARRPVWWDRNDHFSEALAGDVISASPRALLVASDAGNRAEYVLSLGRYLSPSTRVLLFNRAIGEVPRESDVFVLLPSAGDIQALRKQGFAVRNVSPDLGFAVPDLGSAGIAASDSLYKLYPR